MGAEIGKRVLRFYGTHQLGWAEEDKSKAESSGETCQKNQKRSLVSCRYSGGVRTESGETCALAKSCGGRVSLLTVCPFANTVTSKVVGIQPRELCGYGSMRPDRSFPCDVWRVSGCPGGFAVDLPMPGALHDYLGLVPNKNL